MHNQFRKYRVQGILNTISQMPPTMICEECGKRMPRQSIEINYLDTGMDVCRYCIDELPEFAKRMIDAQRWA